MDPFGNFYLHLQTHFVGFIPLIDEKKSIFFLLNFDLPPARCFFKASIRKVPSPNLEKTLKNCLRCEKNLA